MAVATTSVPSQTCTCSQPAPSELFTSRHVAALQASGRCAVRGALQKLVTVHATRRGAAGDWSRQEVRPPIHSIGNRAALMQER
eukprot:CAMPEP_0175211234 /NCGR_PEP_ID=MMETSP0093-20121207/15053_1 /TAXON_ID=311494 /ORGANISM="Alexandrium monilatum, Strain CCMP3105" /LENGTH=83 /DNA_ID=CAMNT_0016504483 /DNA_START=109 /DNA_END=356 /DNA_ORIENTATION=+